MKHVIVSNPEIVHIVKKARESKVLWKQIPALITRLGYCNTHNKEFHVTDLQRVYFERYPEGRTNKYKTKTPTKFKPIPETLLIRAIAFREAGVKYEVIEETFTTEGHRDTYGRPYNNAHISASVVNDPRGAHLRVNKKKSKKFKRQFKRIKPVELEDSKNVFSKLGLTFKDAKRFGLLNESDLKPAPVELDAFGDVYTPPKNPKSVLERFGLTSRNESKPSMAQTIVDNIDDPDTTTNDVITLLESKGVPAQQILDVIKSIGKR